MRPHDDVMLRPATLADADRLARLWVSVFPDKFGPVLGPNAEAVLCDWFRLSQRHLQTTTMAEVDETTVGFIVLETPTSPRPDDGRWLWHALQLHNGIMGALRGLLLMLVVDIRHQTSADEVYVEMIGVEPAWQGQGVARSLLHFAETIAEAQHARQLRLNVVTDNLTAVNLYEKVGFKIESERHSRLLQWITGHPGYYEMAKAVAGKP